MTTKRNVWAFVFSTLVLTSSFGAWADEGMSTGSSAPRLRSFSEQGIKLKYRCFDPDALKAEEIEQIQSLHDKKTRNVPKGSEELPFCHEPRLKKSAEDGVENHVSSGPSANISTGIAVASGPNGTNKSLAIAGGVSLFKDEWTKEYPTFHRATKLGTLTVEPKISGHYQRGIADGKSQNHGVELHLLRYERELDVSSCQGGVCIKSVEFEPTLGYQRDNRLKTSQGPVVQYNLVMRSDKNRQGSKSPEGCRISHPAVILPNFVGTAKVGENASWGAQVGWNAAMKCRTKIGQKSALELDLFDVAGSFVLGRQNEIGAMANVSSRGDLKNLGGTPLYVGAEASWKYSDAMDADEQRQVSEATVHAGVAY